jgi:sulfoxide reductase catalytic subunit YedY
MNAPAGEAQLAFEQVKSMNGAEFVADFADIGARYGGFTRNDEFFGYRQWIRPGTP